MIIVFDLGNSDLSFAAYNEDDSLYGTFRTATDRTKSVDEYAGIIKQLLELKNINLKDIKGTILSSVVPSLTKVLETAIERLLVKPIMVGPGIKTGLIIKCDNPNELGSDIVACCVGAIQNHSIPSIIVDLGTATKIIAIDKNKAFVGCTIAPGLKTSTNHMVSIASQLPEISFDLPEKVICTNTVDCMNSGVVNGNAAMVEGMIDRFENELGYKCTHIITGGLGTTVAKALHIEYVVDKRLIFEGLLNLYHKNEARYE